MPLVWSQYILSHQQFVTVPNALASFPQLGHVIVLIFIL